MVKEGQKLIVGYRAYISLSYLLTQYAEAMGQILETSFFDRPVLTVGRDLLGKFLVRKRKGKEIALPITELEIYDGFKDRASHAFRGKTARNQIMFEVAGHFYIYLVYGMHWMLNVVIGPKCYPAAILIRGAGNIHGPGKLTDFLSIDGKLNAKLAIPTSGLWFEDRGLSVPDDFVERTARVGVSYAGKIWARKPYRFILKKPSKI